MKSFLLLISFLFCNELVGQVLLVSDELGNPLPYFTLSLETENSVLIGGNDGRLSLAGINENIDCGYSIRYLGYQVYHFCMSDLKPGENRIVLKPAILELPEATITGLSDEELIRRFKLYLTKMVDRFNVSRAIVVEKSDFFHWESLGVITLGGLQDRTKKDYRFEGGNLGFLPQYSRFWVGKEDQIPFNARIAVASTLTQDLLFEVLKSDFKNWSRVNSTDSNQELFNLESHQLVVHLNPDGSPQRIEIKQRDFRAPTGLTYQIGGQLEFIRDEKIKFLSAFNFKVTDEYLTEISGVIPDFPKEIILPDKFKNRSERERLMSAFHSYTRSPDYNYNNSEIENGIRSSMVNVSVSKKYNLKLVTQDYTQADLYKGNDLASKKYLAQNSEFIRGVLKIFKDYELAW
jgi:hypothetical protein